MGARAVQKEGNTKFSGRWLSGQRRWAVNPVSVMLYGGSNPPLLTNINQINK